MSIVLFYINSGCKINEYDTEEEAREQMRILNDNAGWKRIKTTWNRGCEMEWCSNGKSHKEGPYAIVDLDLWMTKINPNNYNYYGANVDYYWHDEVYNS